MRFVITTSSATITKSDGTILNIGDGHHNFQKVLSALRNGEFHLVEDLINEGNVLRNYLNTKGFGGKLVLTQDGELYYGGEPIHHSLMDKLVDMRTQGLEIRPLVNFLERLLENPSRNSVEQFYHFIERNRLVIDEDGFVLAYKGVRHDYKDQHSGTFDNSVGARHKMLRYQVDDNRNVACSTGFHVGSWEYVKGFGSHKMVAKFDPKDVVSVPLDHSDQKVRVCEYEIIAEVNAELFKTTEIFTGHVVNSAELPQKIEPIEFIDLNTLYAYKIHVRGLTDDGEIVERVLILQHLEQLEDKVEAKWLVEEFENSLDGEPLFDGQGPWVDYKVVSYEQVDNTSAADGEKLTQYAFKAVFTETSYNYDTEDDEEEVTGTRYYRVWDADQSVARDAVEESIETDDSAAKVPSFDNYDLTLIKVEATNADA